MIDLAEYEGRPGYYCKAKIEQGPSAPPRFVCLNCTSYFQTRVRTTRLGRLTFEGWQKVRYCPACGCELRYLVSPKQPDQLSMDL